MTESQAKSNPTADGDPAPAALFRRAQRRDRPVPVKVKFFQGVGALPGQHKDWAFTTLLLLYYSQVLGLPATYAAVVLAVSTTLDALSDPLTGALSDNFRSRLGRRHPFMFASIAPTCLLVYALFVPPAGLSVGALAGWMFVCTVGVRLSFTFFAVPWNAVAAELSEDYRERTSIITYRMAVGWIGGVIFIFAMYTWVFPTSPEHANGLMDPSRYSLFAVVLATLMGVWLVTTTAMTRGQIRFLPQPTGTTSTRSLRDILRRTWLALGSRNFRLLFLATLISAAVTGTGQVFDVYMNLYFWEFSTEDIRWFSLSVIGAIASFATAGVIQMRFQKHHIMIVSLLAYTVLAMIKVLFRFWGIWPDNGDPSLVWIFVAHTSLAVYAVSMLLIMFASMIADIVDEQELGTGLRQEGVFSAGITFAAKATSSLGLVVGGLLLDLFIRFPRGVEPGQVADDTLFLLAVVDGLAVPAINVVPFLLLLGYSLTRERLQQIQAALRDRG